MVGLGRQASAKMTRSICWRTCCRTSRATHPRVPRSASPSPGYASLSAQRRLSSCRPSRLPLPAPIRPAPTCRLPFSARLSSATYRLSLPTCVSWSPTRLSRRHGCQWVWCPRPGVRAAAYAPDGVPSGQWTATTTASTNTYGLWRAAYSRLRGLYVIRGVGARCLLACIGPFRRDSSWTAHQAMSISFMSVVASRTTTRGLPVARRSDVPANSYWHYWWDTTVVPPTSSRELLDTRFLQSLFSVHSSLGTTGIDEIPAFFGFQIAGALMGDEKEGSQRRSCEGVIRTADFLRHLNVPSLSTSNLSLEEEDCSFPTMLPRRRSRRIFSGRIGPTQCTSLSVRRNSTPASLAPGQCPSRSRNPRPPWRAVIRGSAKKAYSRSGSICAHQPLTATSPCRLVISARKRRAFLLPFDLLRAMGAA